MSEVEVMILLIFQNVETLNSTESTDAFRKFFVNLKFIDLVS